MPAVVRGAMAARRGAARRKREKSIGGLQVGESRTEASVSWPCSVRRQSGKNRMPPGRAILVPVRSLGGGNGTQRGIVTSTGFPMANRLGGLADEPGLRSRNEFGNFSAAWKNSVEPSKAALFGTWKLKVNAPDGGRITLPALTMLARSSRPIPSAKR